MPYSRQSLQSIRGRFSERGSYDNESSTGFEGINRLRIGRPNHDVDNEPEQYSFDVSTVTRRYRERREIRKGIHPVHTKEAVSVNAGP